MTADFDPFAFERNTRVQARYDELMSEGRHGHYETMFRVVHEEMQRERNRCALIAEAWSAFVDGKAATEEVSDEERVINRAAAFTISRKIKDPATQI